ncbi:MAG: isochorismatase family protein [Microbacterium sp.]
MATTTDDRVRTGHVADTTPYAWPWNGVLDAARTAVLVVEAPGESAAADQSCVRNAEVVVATIRRAGGAAIRILTRRASPTRPFGGRASAFAAEGTGEIPTDATVSSQGVDGFYGGPLETVLRQARIERLLLVGAWLETSVHSTMRTANDMGFECLLVVDACAPGDADLVANSVSMIEMSGGIFGAVGETARVVEAYAHEGERA